MARWYRTLEPTAQDALAGAAALLGGLLLMELIRTFTHWLPTYPASNYFAICVAAIATSTRRLAPLTTFIVVLLAFALLYQWSVGPVIHFTALAIAGYGVTRAGRLNPVIAALGASAALFTIYRWDGGFRSDLQRILAELFQGHSPGPDEYFAVITPNYSELTLAATIIIGVTILGAIMRNLEDQRHQLEAQNTELELLRDTEARQAVNAERTRIARELHDVVAHHITAIVVRAQAAARVARDDPDALLDAVTWIAGSGKETLTAMRETVAELRTEADPGFTPTGDINELFGSAQRMREAGLDVAVRIEADLRDLEPTTAGALIRIGQEALTNVLLHSQSDRARLVLAAERGGIRLTVTDPGPSKPASGTRRGNGLRHMNERALIAGGAVEAGPDAGGWKVSAWIPRLSR